MAICTKITPDEAAKMLDKSSMYVRIGLRSGRLPFGSAVEMPGGRWSYHISLEAVQNYIKYGVSETFQGKIKKEAPEVYYCKRSL